MKIRLWPRSLAARTAVALLLGLAIVQVAGLTIHALDRLDVQRLGQARDLAVRVVGLYRTIVLTDAPRRAAVLAELHRGPELMAVLSSSPPDVDMPQMPTPEQRLLRVNMNLVPLGAPQLRWREMLIFGGHTWRHAVVGMRLPDGEWLNVTAELEPL
ncbi:MAG: two-component sensor histidine kinase, partial [Rhodopila sp.]|nr:two-component sensor histidine kinase [Rhodopila sp.]